MKKQIALISLAVLAAAAAAQKTGRVLGVGDTAPPLTVAKWIKGEPVQSLSDGNIHVVEFWATWCGPCKQSIPHISGLQKEYAGKATFIGVDSFEHVPDEAVYFPKVEKFVTDFGDKMNYTVAIDGAKGTMAKDWMEAANQNGIPTAFVVDRKGKIAWIGHPMEMDSVIPKVIDGTFDSKAEADKQKAAMASQMAEQEKMMKIMQPIRTAAKAKDYPAAVAAIDNAIAKNPSMKESLVMQKFSFMIKYDEAGAQKFAGQLVNTVYKNEPMALNSIAWTIVQDGSPIKTPNTAVAIKAAELAVKLSNDDPNIMDTLGLAYFRANRIPDAVATEQKAIEKASADKNFDAATLAELKGRLATFQKALKPAN